MEPFGQAIVRFGRLLRGHGFAVSAGSVMDALEAVRLVGVEDPDALRIALQATLMTRIEETASFERLFAEFWLDRLESSAGQRRQDRPDSGDEGLRESTPKDAALVIAEAAISESKEREAWMARPYVVYSRREVLRQQDFKDLPEDRDEQMAGLMREILAPLLRRRALRFSTASSGYRADFRRMFRRNLRYGGEIVELPLRVRKQRIRKLAFLCDVSGSMNAYLRFILRFIREVQQLPTRVETFVFATRLTRVSDVLGRMPFAVAMEQIGKMAMDWRGGTRIGECLEQFTNYRCGAVLRPSTVVVIFSDGWDRGDASMLDRQLARIRMRCHRLLWINPLLGSPSYEPICRGMSVALPHLDHFMTGHNLASLERLAGTLRALLV